MLALIFTLGQPLLFLHSFSELTELPFALVVGLAFLSYQRRRWWWMAALAAIAAAGPAGRICVPGAGGRGIGGASKMGLSAGASGGVVALEHRRAFEWWGRPIGRGGAG